jgi:hypothetical protein
MRKLKLERGLEFVPFKYFNMKTKASYFTTILLQIWFLIGFFSAF